MLASFHSVGGFPPDITEGVIPSDLLAINRILCRKGCFQSVNIMKHPNFISSVSNIFNSIFNVSIVLLSNETTERKYVDAADFILGDISGEQQGRGRVGPKRRSQS